MIFDEENSPAANMTPASMKFEERKPYFALLGRTFEVWGVVEVSGDSKTHIAVRNVPAEILKLTGMTTAPEVVAIERKLVLAHTKPFPGFPRDEAIDSLKTLGENLTESVKEMQERLNSAIEDMVQSGDVDKAYLRAMMRDTEKEFRGYWRDELKDYRDSGLRDAYEWTRPD